MAAPVPAYAPAPEITVGFPFTAERDALKIVSDAIDGAESSIVMTAYSFTSKPTTAALVYAKNCSVTVQLSANEKASSDRYTAVTFLAGLGVTVRLNSRYAIMKNKSMVNDDNTLKRNSFNYTSSAEKRNAGNALVIRDNSIMSKKYQNEFNRLWAESSPVQCNYS
ncbi:PLD-like domain-containing protein [Candidatus Pantoea varia]|uniref:phospholipase D n=1 Tax=Candidatus Pantoea varia TaxID=1881036 RepID=A0A1I5EN43_9GAMM|nr:phospholipase D-like domain-containing protein [Pantoea varia]SFO12879.1 PLD-like domain-containing protein [Pantoea varia]